MTRPDIYHVRTRDQIEAMTSPVKLEILDAARVLGTCSVKEIADLVGRTADSLYHHVHGLVDVGLLINVGERKASRRTEQLYQTPGKKLRMPHDLGESELTELRLKTFGALLRMTERDLRTAFESGIARVEGPEKNITNARIKGWLSRDELSEVQSLMDRILEILESNSFEDSEDRDVYAIALYLVPIVPKKRSDRT